MHGGWQQLGSDRELTSAAQSGYRYSAPWESGPAGIIPSRMLVKRSIPRRERDIVRDRGTVRVGIRREPPLPWFAAQGVAMVDPAQLARGVDFSAAAAGRAWPARYCADHDGTDASEDVVAHVPG